MEQSNRNHIAKKNAAFTANTSYSIKPRLISCQCAIFGFLYFGVLLSFINTSSLCFFLNYSITFLMKIGNGYFGTPSFLFIPSINYLHSTWSMISRHFAMIPSTLTINSSYKRTKRCYVALSAPYLI